MKTISHFLKPPIFFLPDENEYLSHWLDRLFKANSGSDRSAFFKRYLKTEPVYYDIYLPMDVIADWLNCSMYDAFTKYTSYKYLSPLLTQAQQAEILAIASRQKEVVKPIPYLLKFPCNEYKTIEEYLNFPYIKNFSLPKYIEFINAHEIHTNRDTLLTHLDTSKEYKRNLSLKRTLALLSEDMNELTLSPKTKIVKNNDYEFVSDEFLDCNEVIYKGKHILTPLKTELITVEQKFRVMINFLEENNFEILHISPKWVTYKCKKCGAIKTIGSSYSAHPKTTHECKKKTKTFEILDYVNENRIITSYEVQKHFPQYKQTSTILSTLAKQGRIKKLTDGVYGKKDD